jgi:hypothetical protein
MVYIRALRGFNSVLLLLSILLRRPYYNRIVLL